MGGCECVQKHGVGMCDPSKRVEHMQHKMEHSKDDNPMHCLGIACMDWNLWISRGRLEPLSGWVMPAQCACT